MDATTYTGISGGTQSITNQYGFKPDLVWTKVRSGTGDNFLNDSVRGAANIISSNTTNANANLPNYLTSFNSNGFSLGTSSYTSTGTTIVGWQWQAGQGTTSSNTQGTITSTVSANVTAGFSIVTYVGNGAIGGAGPTIGHGLGVIPALIIVKNVSNGAVNWNVWQSTFPNGKVMYLNTNLQLNDDTNVWGNTSPTNTVFKVGNVEVNGSGATQVAYCWAQVPGFSAFGSYTGNGSSDGPFIYTGFKPKFLMYKRTNTTSSWFMVDSTRNPYNLANYWLQANTDEAEQTDGFIDFLSNGYKIRGTGAGTNASGSNYIYMAWAENPFKYANAG
jgi:hypothetical protein